MKDYKILNHISKLPALQAEAKLNYSQVLQYRYDVEREICKRLADLLAHELAGQLLLKSIEKPKHLMEEIDGVVYRLTGFWFTHEELYKLAEEMYSMGQLAAREVMPSPDTTQGKLTWSR